MSKKKKYYSVDIYNKYVDNGYAHANLEEFDIKVLLSHPNPRVRDFSLILISKNIESDDYIISKPLYVIYDKNVWKRRFYLTKDRYYFKFSPRIIYSCVHHHEIFNNKLINVPCSDKQKMIEKFYSISKKLVNKQLEDFLFN